MSSQSSASSPSGGQVVNMLSSATAGIAGRLICHPIDTCKSKLQASDTFSSIRQVVVTTWKQEGWRGFYRGMAAVLLGSAPGVCVYMTSYEYSKAQLTQRYPYWQQHPTSVYLVSGMIAEALCCMIFIPVDVIKERLQVQSSGQHRYQYKGSFDGLRTIAREEGIRGLYKGYWATLFSYGPFSAIYFSMYETMKEEVFHAKAKGGSDNLTFLENLASSAVAGGVASLVTNPLEIAKLRFQVQDPTSSSTSPQRNVYQIMTDIWKQHGSKGLLRGAWTRILFHTPSTAITMAVYEECKKAWTQLLY